MILSVFGIIIGVVLVLFLPGYLMSLIIFREIEIPERIFISFGLSVSVVVVLGFFLSFFGYLAGIKAISPAGVAVSLGLVCVGLLAWYLIRMADGKDKAKPDLNRPKPRIYIR